MTKVNEVSIQLESSDQSLKTDLFRHDTVTSGYEIEIEKGVPLRYEHTTLREAVDFPRARHIPIPTIHFQKEYLSSSYRAKTISKKGISRASEGF